MADKKNILVVSLFSLASSVIMYLFDVNHQISTILLTSVWVFAFFALFDGFFSPRSLFYISLLIFLIARPIFAIVLWLPVIQGGIEELKFITPINTLLSSFICLVLITELLTLGLAARLASSASAFARGYSTPAYVGYVTCSAAIISTMFFLFKASQNSIFGNSEDYFQFAQNYQTYFVWFFLSKYLLLITVLLSPSIRMNIIAVSVLALGALGFLLIGLRGYFIVYCFTLLTVISISTNVRFKYIFLVLIGLPLLGGYVLEARLGIKIFDSIFERYFLFFHQQGASYEVVFGTIQNPLPLEQCLSLYSTWESLNGRFGPCVDKIRNLGFASGGYGTSAPAEILYYLPFSLLLVFIIGFANSVGNAVYVMARGNKSDPVVYKSITILAILIIPSYVYFARSSSIDLVVKFLEVVMVVAIIRAASYLLPRGKNDFP